MTNEMETDEQGYPGKFEKQRQSAQVWLTSVVSLAAWLVISYLVFPSYKILLLITIVVIIHELGHFFAMKTFRYKDLGIFFIPLLAAYVSGSKREVSQRESAIILLAGPLPGIIIGIIFYLLFRNDPSLSIAGISFYTISLTFLLLNIINLIPVYPLDGGQLLNRVFLDEDSIISKVFVFCSIGFLVWFALFGGPKPYYPLLLFPAMILYRMVEDGRSKTLERKIAESGINMDVPYEELPDEDYWKLRNIIILNDPAFAGIPTAPPYEFHEKEGKIMNVIRAMLHRHLIQDMHVIEKILLVIIWCAALLVPWFLGIYQSIFHQLSR